MHDEIAAEASELVKKIIIQKKNGEFLVKKKSVTII